MHEVRRDSVLADTVHGVLRGSVLTRAPSQAQRSISGAALFEPQGQETLGSITLVRAAVFTAPLALLRAPS